jgi:nitroreductase
MPESRPPGSGDLDPRETLRPLRRVRQVRQFTDEPVEPVALDAIADVGRWSGSSKNDQPWRFIVIRDEAILRAIHDAGVPQTRSLATATAGIAIVLPADATREVVNAYDDGRAAERMLIAANLLDLGAAIAWIRRDVRPAVEPLLGLPDGWMIRTILAIGHPTEAARQPKAAPGEARRPRGEAVFRERWPDAAARGDSG